MTPDHDSRALPDPLASQRLRLRDVLWVGSIGIRTRKLRAALSALGIAIGAAAIVGILGISSSSQAALLAEIDALGTNLLTVSTGQTTFGDTAALPKEAPGRISRLDAVESIESAGKIDIPVYRNPFIPAVNTNGIGLSATTLDLPDALGIGLAHGTFLNAATATEPVAVLGSRAASRLGFDDIKPGTRIWIDQQWFSVAGILEPSVLAPEIDTSVLVGFDAAEKYLGFDGHPTTIYLRADPNDVESVHALLARAANPENPSEVTVSRPSDALVARAATESALNSLFLGLGAISLLVGSVGVANTMIVSVLERRSEIGLRRALGATRGHIRAQFFNEAILLSLLGGGAGIVAGILATVVYASVKGWMIVIPTVAWTGGLAAALVIGAVAGLLPAIRAARMSPTEALWTS
jgi:putative ABC transport system permease protein